MATITPFELFKDCAVTDAGVRTVAEFLTRYYKSDKYTDRGGRIRRMLACKS